MGNVDEYDLFTQEVMNYLNNAKCYLGCKKEFGEPCPNYKCLFSDIKINNDNIVEYICGRRL